MMSKLFVANLPYDIDERGLAAMFAEYGALGRVNIAVDRSTGTSRGFGFVEIEDDCALAAVEAFDGVKVQGRSIHVRVAREERKIMVGPGRRTYREQRAWEGEF
jgi:RNA recognition motif-containing protein